MRETTTSQEMIEVVTCSYQGHGYTVKRSEIETVMDGLADAEDGDVYEIRFHRMNRAEYEALPEFDGW